VKVVAERTVPAGSPVFVTVIVPIAAPAGTLALSFVLET
jgi:hypothetical protein